MLHSVALNPVPVSYLLGASGVRFSTFMVATVGLIPGLIPGLIVGVHSGNSASHVTKVDAGNASDHSTLQTVVGRRRLCRLCVAVMFFIARIAAKALSDAETESTPHAAGLAT